jgi:hypothetical protein
MLRPGRHPLLGHRNQQQERVMTMKSMVAMLAVLVTLGLAPVSVQASSLGIAETTELCQTDGSESYCKVLDHSGDEDDDVPGIVSLLAGDEDDD